MSFQGEEDAPDTILHVVQVTWQAREHPAVRFLHRSKHRLLGGPDSGVANTDSNQHDADMLCGPIRVLAPSFSSLQDRQRQVAFAARVRRCRQLAPSKSTAVVVLVMSDVDEPHLDVLTWLNELCLAEQCTLQLSWSGEEAARLLEGLADSAVTSVDFITKPRETKPLPALIDALTQPDTHLIKQDAVRLASKFGTVANMLLMAPDTPLPSFGPKKVSRVSEIFRAPFGASSAAHNSNAGGGSTNIVISSGTAPRGLEGAGGGGAAPPQQTSASSASPLPMHSVAFAAALERHRFHEATEEDV